MSLASARLHRFFSKTSRRFLPMNPSSSAYRSPCRAMISILLLITPGYAFLLC